MKDVDFGFCLSENRLATRQRHCVNHTQVLVGVPGDPPRRRKLIDSAMKCVYFGHGFHTKKNLERKKTSILMMNSLYCNLTAALVALLCDPLLCAVLDTIMCVTFSLAATAPSCPAGASSICTCSKKSLM